MNSHGSRQLERKDDLHYSGKSGKFQTGCLVSDSKPGVTESTRCFGQLAESHGANESLSLHSELSSKEGKNRDIQVERVFDLVMDQIVSSSGYRDYDQQAEEVLDGAAKKAATLAKKQRAEKRADRHAYDRSGETVVWPSCNSFSARRGIEAIEKYLKVGGST